MQKMVMKHTRRITPCEKKKKVAVIGGGPAGLEAARVAALRGHDVTLFEKTTTLGGQLNIACVPPRKEEMRRATQDLVRAVINANVHLCLAHAPSVKELKEAGFDTVINAVGAHSFAPKISGIENVNVLGCKTVCTYRVDYCIKSCFFQFFHTRCMSQT